jgi:hypothetical protein
MLHIEPTHIYIRSGHTPKRKHATQEGAVWTSAVAEYMTAMYPELLGDENENRDVIRLMKGNLYI